jgi:hypothetical protein
MELNYLFASNGRVVARRIQETSKILKNPNLC